MGWSYDDLAIGDRGCGVYSGWTDSLRLYCCVVWGLAVKRFLFALVFVLLPHVLWAQEVNKWANGVSWATAFVNPTVAAVDALKSEQKGCRLARLALSEAIGNGVTIVLKHVIESPRPCVGCAADGFPSGHTANSFIGVSGWRYGFAFGFTTGQLRRDAHRHTFPQVLAGAAIGIGSEFAGRVVKCP